MAGSDLDDALAIGAVSDGLWSAHAHRGYEAANGMFGGWTAAVALRAVCDSADGDATPSTLTINYVSVIEPGTELHITTRRVGGGRSVSHWQSEVMSVDHDVTMAYASVVLANRRDTDGHVDVAMPADPPEPEAVGEFRPPGTFGEHTLMRTIEGFPPRPGNTHSLAWVRELSGRPVDHLLLAYLSDVRPPRSFYWGEGPRPSATFALSVYFHATAPELAAVGDDYLVSEAFGTRGAQSTSEEHLRSWSRQGALLATSEQMAWYR